MERGSSASPQRPERLHDSRDDRQRPENVSDVAERVAEIGVMCGSVLTAHIRVTAPRYQP